MKQELKLLKRANGNLVRTEAEKQQMIEQAAKHYGDFLTALGFDWQADENTKKTPYRYAKSFVDDFIWGCVNPMPKVTAFPNDEGYNGLVIQTNIPVHSMCSHHHREVEGLAHVAYIPGTGPDDLVIGLSKLNRIVNWYAKRPQLQEGLTKQIHDKLNELIKGNRGIAVVIEAQHGCVKCRQLHHDSTMMTSQLSGYFFDVTASRNELFSLIDKARKK